MAKKNIFDTYVCISSCTLRLLQIIFSHNIFTYTQVCVLGASYNTVVDYLIAVSAWIVL